MQGYVLDWVVTHTVKDGEQYVSGQTEERDILIKDSAEQGLWSFPYTNLTVQPKYNKILDVGAFDVNGSMRTYDFYRRGPLWPSLVSDTEDYTGIDIGPGRGVDIVMNANNMAFSDNTFDLILCLEMLEHDPNPPATISEMYRVLQPGCPIVFTCAGEDHPTHIAGISQSYLHIPFDDLIRWFEDAKFNIIEQQIVEVEYALYAVK